MEARQTGAASSTLPLDISALIATNSTTRPIFPRSDGARLGEQCSIGLPYPSEKALLHGVEKDLQGRGLWITISAIDTAGQRKEARVLLLDGKSGKDAIYSDLIQRKSTAQEQSAALIKLYEEAREAGSAFLLRPLDISLLIKPDGGMQRRFPLPNGARTGAYVSIGLPQPITEAQLERVERDPEGRGLWVTISALNKNKEKRSTERLLLFDQVGAEAVQSRADLQSTALKRLYNEAQEGRAVLLAQPLDISLLVTAYGLTRTFFPLPNGEGIGETVGVGLCNHLATAHLRKLIKLTDKTFALFLEGTTLSGAKRHSICVVSPQGLTTRKQLSASAEICKGFALDRYVAYLFARSQTAGVTHQFLSGSLLTGENFEPNILSGCSIIHSKWGNRAQEVVDYILKYERARRWIGSLDGAVHLVASEKHLGALKEIVRDAAEKLQLGPTEVAYLPAWAQQTLEINSEETTTELERLEIMASLGESEWLSGRRFEPTLPSGAGKTLDTASSWQERIKVFAN